MRTQTKYPVGFLHTSSNSNRPHFTPKIAGARRIVAGCNPPLDAPIVSLS